MHNLAILCNLSPIFAADKTAPKNGRISINSGSEYANSNFVTLDIYAEDDSSIQVWISNDGENGTVVDFEVNKTVDITDSSYVVGTALDDTNSTTTTNEDNVLRITNWPVTEGDGSKRVHVVFNDAYGNNTSLTGYITITVTYDLNDVEGTVPKSNETLKGMGVYLPEASANDNRPFYGWSESPTADIANYHPSTLTVFNEDIRLYAVFQMPQIGDYIDYGIEYTDVYTNYEFSGDWGWRVLNTTKNDDGTSNVEIISTGIPATLYYERSTLGSAPWIGDSEQRTEYKNEYYVSSSLDSNNMKAAAGLLYNFEKIIFNPNKETSIPNEGAYTLITGSHGTETGLFKADNIDENKINVRSVMHADLTPDNPNKVLTSFNDPAQGLFTLSDLSINPHTAEWYWLASPNDGSYFIYRITYAGVIGSMDERTHGVRPVVLISNINLYYDNGVWRIKDALPKYTVTFNANSGTGTMADVKVTSGKEYTLPECVYISTSCFDAWEVDGVRKNPGDTIVITKDTEVKAIWGPIGAYVNYGIDYTDVYTGYEYSGDYGWRILSKEDNGDGTSNIEIISTGIPAQMNYLSSSMDSASWVGNSSQRNQYKNDYYIGTGVDEYNVKAAAGLLYNFEYIKFNQGTGTPASNEALYTSISGCQHTTEGFLFKSAKYLDKIINVRSVMHTDLNPESPKKDIIDSGYTEMSIGLFNLKYLEIDSHTDGYYFLASPASTGNASVRLINSGGEIGGTTGYKSYINGLRPVVSLANVKLENDNSIWRITNAAQQYTVTFNANGGSGTMPDVKVTENCEYVLPECTFNGPSEDEAAENTSYWFNYWEVDGEQKSAGERIVITKDTEIKAVWAKINIMT